MADPKDTNQDILPPIGQPIQKQRAEGAEGDGLSGNEQREKEKYRIREQPRDGDFGVGQPIQVPRNEEQVSIRPSTIDADQDSQAESLSEPDLLASPLKKPRILSSSSFLILTLGVFSALILFIYAQSLIIISQLKGYHLVVKVPAYILLLFLLTLVLIVTARLIVLLIRLRRNRPVSFDRIRTSVGSQKETQVLSKARKVLTEYLMGYQIEESGQGTMLKSLGFIDEDVIKLNKLRGRLLDDRPISDGAWIKEFQETFLNILDRIANRRVNRAARLVAIKTTASPWSVVDALIVLFHNARLLGDLMKIYKVRSDKHGNIYLLFWVMVNTYFAGQMEELSEEISEEIVQDILKETAGGVAANVAGKLAAKASEAAANFLFTRRIGKKGILLLRPLS